ncbi:hypothetical protein THAOC_12099 [Thalassiosira oceanica]|uniref:Uncharacterized protein n=1 Tax=Thalassiosira oceanica TaxID=159749 RepID=K0SKT4_THAOC|nr:hypothetical protein THAOC_12099 [Thalassiosira oceanica]|eukprot:EJK66928.1 hypothetical protein THAOC_12099 [Thalassiosira oceanica]
MKIDRSARSAYEVALWKALGLGITERAPERPGRACKACNRRNSALASVRKGPSIGKTRPAAGWVEGGTSSTRGQNWTKSSFLESSRRALQVTANRRIQVRARPAARGLAAFERTKKERCDVETTPGTAGSSRVTRRCRRPKPPRTTSDRRRRSPERARPRVRTPGDPVVRGGRDDSARGERPSVHSDVIGRGHVDPAERFGIVPSTSSPPLRPVGPVPRTTCRDRVPRVRLVDLPRSSPSTGRAESAPDDGGGG